MRRIRSLIAGIALIPAALATANAQAGWPTFPEDEPWPYSSPRYERGPRRVVEQTNQVALATTLLSSAFSLALSGNGKDGIRAAKPWGWSAIGVGVATALSGFVAFQQPGAEPLLAMASLVSGGFSMSAGARVLRGSRRTPDEGAFFPPRESASVEPVVAPAARAAGINVTIRF